MEKRTEFCQLLRLGVRVRHEDDIVRFCYECGALQKMCITYGDNGVDESTRVEDLSGLEDETFVAVEIGSGSQQRDDLMNYLTYF